MNLADMFDLAEAEARAETARADAARTPEVEARLREKSAAEWQRGIDLGWYDADGDPGPNADPADDEDDGE